ncbi:MAG: ribonuclease H [Allorhizobium sp.]
MNEIEATNPTAALNAIPAKAQVEIYTDGACLSNPGPAAAAFAVIYQGVVIHSAARFLGNGTNNVGEISAAIDGLRFLADRPDLSITLLSDSEQVVKAMPEWVPKWKAKGWRKADGKPVTNRPLYEELDAIASGFPSLKWKHVKGHAGHEFNELVDGLANGAAEAGAAAASRSIFEIADSMSSALA